MCFAIFPVVVVPLRFLGNAHAVVEADGGIEVRPQCPRTEGWAAQLVTRHLDLLPTSG